MQDDPSQCACETRRGREFIDRRVQIPEEPKPMCSIKGTLNAIESISDCTWNGYVFEFEIVNILHLWTPLWMTELTA